MSTSVPVRPRHLGAVLALLAFAQLIIAIDYNIVFVSLPEIGEGLGFSSQNLQWVVSAYAVAFGGFLLLGGRATDLFGRKRIFILGLFLYASSSLVGGLATAPWLLIAARAVQGLGGAFLSPATLSLVTTLFREGAERNRALSVWGGAGGSGMVLGSILGGLLTQVFGWASVFYVNVIFAGAAMLVAVFLLPNDRATTRGAFDLPGALTGTIASTLLVFALVQGPEAGWGSPVVLTAFVVAVVLLAAFLVIESKSRAPMVPLRLFTNRNLSVGVSITFLFMATFGALAYFLTQFWQVAQGYSAWATGFAFVVPSGSVLIGTILGGKSATKLGIRKTLVISLSMGVVGMIALALSVSEGVSYATLVPSLAVLSLGQGMVFTNMFAAATTGIPADDQGIGSGIATTGQQIGGAVGLAVLIAITATASGETAGDPAALTDGVRTATWLIAAGIGLTILVALNLRKSTPPSAEEDEPEEIAPTVEKV
ncbi:drug resistance transporter, EmrB/QacA subfamily [Actinopolyspora xinjiangensis]|uniref:Drug resistance transporter, EmrB/QacA subfamily n=1 Tax=Actinopolyspora xinjiangensis TaxID=405564 RepID=A0A1H0VM67_9ACTN|nr:MFS transporter [Actinopolyspora xinjiangensis]SDP79308.1 drug resistance transporter, EmrB/QacA subfamily [Actinopolyspora xinjiangensis]